MGAELVDVSGALFKNGQSLCLVEGLRSLIPQLIDLGIVGPCEVGAADRLGIINAFDKGH